MVPLVYDNYNNNDDNDDNSDDDNTTTITNNNNNNSNIDYCIPQVSTALRVPASPSEWRCEPEQYPDPQSPW